MTSVNMYSNLSKTSYAERALQVQALHEECARAEQGEAVDLRQTAEKLGSLVGALRNDSKAMSNPEVAPKLRSAYRAHKRDLIGLTARVNALSPKTGGIPAWVNGPAVCSALSVAALVLAYKSGLFSSAKQEGSYVGYSGDSLRQTYVGEETASTTTTAAETTETPAAATTEIAAPPSPKIPQVSSDAGGTLSNVLTWVDDKLTVQFDVKANQSNTKRGKKIVANNLANGASLLANYNYRTPQAIWGGVLGLAARIDRLRVAAQAAGKNGGARRSDILANLYQRPQGLAVALLSLGAGAVALPVIEAVILSSRALPVIPVVAVADGLVIGASAWALMRKI